MTRSVRFIALLTLVGGGAYAFAHGTPGAHAAAPAVPTPGAPIYVWIQPASVVAGWTARDVAEVERAFDAWSGIVPDVRFAFSDDSAEAPVRVIWISRFDEPMTGQSRLVRDADGTVTDASVRLATHHPDGRPVTGDEMRSLAMHEVGHLLGLSHSSDPRSIMAPVVHVRVLSHEDSAALRRIESVEGRE